jgi:hypothetical protein
MDFAASRIFSILNMYASTFGACNRSPKVTVFKAVYGFELRLLVLTQFKLTTVCGQFDVHV